MIWPSRTTSSTPVTWCSPSPLHNPPSTPTLRNPSTTVLPDSFRNRHINTFIPTTNHPRLPTRPIWVLWCPSEPDRPMFNIDFWLPTFTLPHLQRLHLRLLIRRAVNVVAEIIAKSKRLPRFMPSSNPILILQSCMLDLLVITSTLRSPMARPNSSKKSVFLLCVVSEIELNVRFTFKTKTFSSKFSTWVLVCWYFITVVLQNFGEGQECPVGVDFHHNR